VSVILITGMGGGGEGETPKGKEAGMASKPSWGGDREKEGKNQT